jgi:hypothetical protein
MNLIPTIPGLVIIGCLLLAMVAWGIHVHRDSEAINAELRLPPTPGVQAVDNATYYELATGPEREVIEWQERNKAVCLHRQAEPVILNTGEQVASVCIECLAPLSADHIEKQRAKAEIAAYCRHEDRISIRSLGEALNTEICMLCSERGVAWSIYDPRDMTHPISAVPFFSSHDKALEAARRYIGYGYDHIEIRPASQII